MNGDMMFLPTGIGSLPHTDSEAAVDLVLETIPKCPHWPQLPNACLCQRMDIQFSEGLPGITIDETKSRMFFATFNEEKCAATMASFYEKYMDAQDSDNWSAFAMSGPFAQGIYLLESELSRRALRPEWIKLQTTGPITVGLCCKDEKNRPIYHNETYRDCIIKGLAAKSRWQIDKFKEYSDNLMCFIDEPMLYAFGETADGSLPREEGIAALAEVVEAIHGAGALCGVHCCGNAPWSLAMEAGVDILSFDAFGYGDSLVRHAKELKRFLENDNFIAWGIVPTSDKIAMENSDSLIARYDECVETLAAHGLDNKLVYNQSMLTPSCGTALLSIAEAQKVYAVLGALSKALRTREGKED